jgi:beta-fructofuranosidase
MSWGSVVSGDLLRWRRNKNSPVLEPSEPYDREGVFTGCLFPSGPRGENEMLTVIYSSVCRLPFHWTSPYPRGSAGLAAATSKDKGRTWVKSKRNPILGEEPPNFDVTGFRDPYIARWKILDELRGKESLYGIVAGGVRDCGPAVFLYSVQTRDLLHWEYMGLLMTLPQNFRPSRKWCGDSGVNWECTNFMTLRSGTQSRHFLLTGSEGGEERDHIIQSPRTQILNLPQRTIRWSLWICGHPILNDDNSISFQYDFGGILDHGCFYAANSFADPLTGRRIFWGWMPEEDVTLNRCRAKGCLSLPREVYLLEILDVVHAWRTPLDELASFELHREPSGSFTMRTLGIKPLPDLARLRRQKLPSFTLSNCSLPTVATNISTSTSTSSYASFMVESLATLPIRSTKWELEAKIAIHPNCSRVGFHIHHRSNLATRTSVYFFPSGEEIVVDRSNSRPIPGRATESKDDDNLVNTRDERGPHTLFAFASTNQNGDPGETIERLHLHIFRDGSILEVFANDRFALSTMIYIDDDDEATVAAISAFAENAEAGCFAAAAAFEDVRVYELCDSIIDTD